MKKTPKQSPAKNFADLVKDKPNEIIKWAKSEIKQYEELIKILETKCL